MEVAQYVLEYLKVLAWPIIVSVALIAFRKQIKEKIRSLKELDTPLGTTKWDHDAQQLEVKAEAAAVDQLSSAEWVTPAVHASDMLRSSDGEPSVDGPTTTPNKATAPLEDRRVHQEQSMHSGEQELWSDLMYRAVRPGDYIPTSGSPLEIDRTFDLARKVALSDPMSGLLTAYNSLGQLARSVANLADVAPRPSTLDEITIALQDAGLSSEFVPVAQKLVHLGTEAKRDSEGLTTRGAFSFITAAERLADALLGLRRSIIEQALKEAADARADRDLAE